MPTLYHFNSDQFKENLMLGGQQHMVAGRLCQYLKGWQLDGLRFLYKHFEKGESCILNDESGLGKAVTVSVFLGAILTNDTTKKCLIIVRDDEYIEGWRFHLSVLTHLTVKVIEQTSDINYETVFLIKWSTLKNIGQITKVAFDHVIIDNRGEMMNNKFCTGLLLRYYENKTSIVISSADVTADIKFLHILLRLCGRLDKQYTDVKLFEDKFQLPKLKEGVCSKVDLEDYFLKREKVINYCREFRLRRYCHQFDEEFPIVPCSEFKKHVEQWRNSDNSQSSGSVKLLSSSSEKDIEELFKAYFQVKEERDTRKLDCEVQQITDNMSANDNDVDVSDEVVIMSPLLLVSESESDSEQADLQMETCGDFADEIKDEEDDQETEKEAIAGTKSRIERSPIRNRRKCTQPMKRQTEQKNRNGLVYKKTLRSRNASVSLLIRRNSMNTMSKKLDEKLPKKRGRPRKVLRDESTTESNRKDKRHLEVRERTQRKDLNADKKKKISNHEEVKKTNKQEKKNVRGNKVEDKTQSKGDKEISKKKLIKLDEDKRKSKEDERKSTPKLEEGKKRSRVDALTATKTSTKLQKDNKGFGDEVKKDRKKQENIDQKKNTANENEQKDRQKIKKTSQDEEKKAITVREKLKKKPHKPQEENKEHKDKLDKNEENQRKRGKHDDGEKRNESKTDKSPKAVPKPHRNCQIDLILYEADKFMNNKNISSKKTAKADIIITRTRTRDTQEVPVTSPKSTSTQKDKAHTPKRGRPLTELAPLGVHSKSTRGMQRYTRSYPIHSKYMKIATAQVGIHKAKRRLYRRKVVTSTKISPSSVNNKPELPLPVVESPAILESMQLGQELTPTNGPLVTFVAPPPKNMDYNFPLMLDKDIPDSECLISSQNSNSEIIILTGSTTDNEMEPPKSTVSRRKINWKPPMVAIPRPSFNKAKSPDLFSTCSDLSLPCSQQQSNKSHFEGFKIFGSELRRSCLDVLDRISDHRKPTIITKKSTPSNELPTTSTKQHCVDDEDAMFEITSNGTFGNVVRVNSSGDMSPVRSKGQSTPPSGHPKNRITNYLISNNQHVSGAAPSSSLEDTSDLLPKTPNRRKSVSGTVKRSPKSSSGGIGGAKSQTTKLTQWLVKNAGMRVSETPPKQLPTKRRRLDLSFHDD